MDYETVKETKDIYETRLIVLTSEIYRELEIDGLVETNCKNEIVIRSYKEIPKEKLKKLEDKGFHGYKHCDYAREDYPYNYVLYPDEEKEPYEI